MVLRFPTGQEVSLNDTVVVVGRDPTALPTDRKVRRVAINDPSHTVSKTHFACGSDETGVWVEDRQSTNGTVVIGTNGQAVKLRPGQRERVTTNVTLAFGDYEATIGPSQ